MSGTLTTFAIDLDRVRKAIGSGSRTLLPSLRRRFDAWFDNVNEQVADQGEGSPTLEEVLQRLIEGKPIQRRWWFQFAVALELLYRRFGKDLTQFGGSFCSIHWAWAEEVDEAIKQAGVSEKQFGFVQHLFCRGPALRFAGIIEPPISMGWLSLAQVRRALKAFDRADFSELEPEVGEAVEEIRSWLLTCDKMERDLASFYSG